MGWPLRHPSICSCAKFGSRSLERKPTENRYASRNEDVAYRPSRAILRNDRRLGNTNKSDQILGVFGHVFVACRVLHVSAPAGCMEVGRKITPAEAVVSDAPCGSSQTFNAASIIRGVHKMISLTALSFLPAAMGTLARSYCRLSISKGDK